MKQDRQVKALRKRIDGLQRALDREIEYAEELLAISARDNLEKRKWKRRAWLVWWLDIAQCAVCIVLLGRIAGWW